MPPEVTLDSIFLHSIRICSLDPNAFLFQFRARFYAE